MHRDPAAVIDHFIALVLSHADREYPNKLDHVINDPSDLRAPRDLHPVFFGSFDWHSCVHGHWLLARALRLYPTLNQSAAAIASVDARLTDANIKAEIAYLARPLRQTFERPYGWGWLMKLAAELRLPVAAGVPDAHKAALARWSSILQPLTDAFIDRWLAFLPKATYPIRVGTHNNTAFAIALTIDYARTAAHKPLEDALTAKARAWYLADANYPAWEPDGTDFLSPGLVEAECLRRILPAAEFVPWFDRFLPNLAKSEPKTLFTPATVSDRTDGQITHLDGLNLCRAWCWRSLAAALPASDPRKPILDAAATLHLEAALPHVSGDYMGEHWLATFAMLAMTE